MQRMKALARRLAGRQPTLSGVPHIAAVDGADNAGDGDEIINSVIKYR